MSSINYSMVEIKGKYGNIEAYLVRPVDMNPRPAIIVIHEIFGLVEHIKDIANRFANMGFVAIAPNVYSSFTELSRILTPENVYLAFDFMQKIPIDKARDLNFLMQEANKLSEDKRNILLKLLNTIFTGNLPYNKFTEELTNVVEYLKAQDFVIENKIGSIGFCFGGGMSLLLACYTKINACVTFYGQNPNPIELVEKIACPVLGIYGGEDMRINQNLDKLVAAMVRYKKDFEMKIYPGAPHAFFNDTNPKTYREAAAKDAWERTLRFYNYCFSQN
jgi:carboxymethylenebutenolidase